MNLNKLDENIDVFSLDEYQRRILNGLKEIGEEIATLYKDGVKIFKSNLGSKPYLLAHIAREIEGGIRDIFASNKKTEIQKCPQCGTTKKSLSHIDEICEVLGVDKNDKFAQEWYRIAKEFHKYAHRHGSWKNPREKEEFNDLWEQFERKVLYYLVGNYLNLLSLVDKVLSYHQPTKEILETLSTLLQNEARRRYFFKKLSSVEWFYPLKEKGYFAPEEALGPKPADKEGHFIIPYWNVLDYLEKVSQQVAQPSNEKYADELLEIIKDITNYHIKHDRILDNYHTWWYFVKILVNLPNDKITDEIIDFIPIWLDSKFDNDLPASEILNNLLPKFLSDENSEEDIKKAEKIVDYVTQIKWIPKYSKQYKKEIREKFKHIFEKPEEELAEDEKLAIYLFSKLYDVEPKTIVDIYRLQETFINGKLAEKIGEKCSENVIFNIADKLKNIFDQRYKETEGEKKYDLSYIWLGSMFDTSEFIFKTEEILTLILRDILLAKVKVDKGTAVNIINEFLGNKYPYPLFRRLVLFVIGSIWGTYKDIFWKMLNEDEDSMLFNDPHYKAEVYTILQKHVSQFSLEEKEKIKKIIEEKVSQGPYPKEEDREYYQASWRQFWYSAMKSDEYFKHLYENYKNITKKEEKISFKAIEISEGPGPSPLTKEQILQMPNQELAEYLRTFKTVDFWEGPTINGLSNMLRSSAQEKPEKFIDDLNPFLKTGYLYVYNILMGIRDAWEWKKAIDWGKLFNFIKEYITPEDFWDDKYKIEGDDWKANHLWVVGMIGELIRQGTYDDSWAFSEEHFQTAQEVLFFIIDKMVERKEIEQPISGDFVTFALNSSWGKITEALFLLALRIKRVEKKSNKPQPVSWELGIKDKYDLLLNNEILESYVWLGFYLPYFYYMDKEWTENRIKELETIYSTNKQLWEAFMNGHLFGREIYYELYILMRKHYDIAINYQFENEDLHDQLIRYICVGYLQGIEDINDTNSLLRKIIDKWKISEIKQMISFFRMLKREEQNEQIKSKIISFWRWIYENKYKEKQENELTGDDKKILSELCKLTVFLPEIDSENFEWLKISAPFVDFSYHSSLFIEYLNNLKDKGESVNFIGKIYLEMLKHTTPYFRQEDIQSIVEYLYQNGKKEEADEICNIYAERGYEFLIPLYEKYNKV